MSGRIYTFRPLTGGISSQSMVDGMSRFPRVPHPVHKYTVYFLCVQVSLKVHFHGTNSGLTRGEGGKLACLGD